MSGKFPTHKKTLDKYSLSTIRGLFTNLIPLSFPVNTIRFKNTAMSALMPVLGIGVLLSFGLAARADAPDAPPSTPAPGGAITGPIQSPLVPSTAQVQTDKTWLAKYLTEKSGATLQAPADAPEGFQWSFDVYESAAQQPDGKERTQALYALIGAHLVLAESLIQSRYIDVQLEGMGLAMLAAQCATQRLNDVNLAQVINQAYLQAHLDDAQEESWRQMSLDEILRHLAETFRVASNEKNLGKEAGVKAQAVYRIWLERFPERVQQDYAHLQLFYIAARNARYDDAIKELRAISPWGSMRDMKKLIPETQVKKADADEAAAVAKAQQTIAAREDGSTQ